MKLRSVVFTIALALASLGVAAFDDAGKRDADRASGQDAPRVVNRPPGAPSLHEPGTFSQSNYVIGSSRPFAPIPAVEPGAVLELRLRLHWETVDDYLEKYARWFLPVDQFVCDNGYKYGCQSSGRKLLTVLARDFGDHYNVVFLYRYESAYKEDYYCQYDKAFFSYHDRVKTAGFTTYFENAVKKIRAENRNGQPMTIDDMLTGFPSDCLNARYDKFSEQVLLTADTTLQLINLELARLIDTDEAAWNFDINVCKAGELKRLGDVKALDLREALEKRCPPSKQSLLERAVREWAMNWK